MFRSVWSKTLRDYRVPILGWGLGLGLVLYFVFVAYAANFQDPAARATLEQIVQSFRFFGDPIATNTLLGFANWRAMTLFLPLLLSIWTVLTGARLVRGEEERGSLDILLSTPQSRMRLLTEKILALGTALVLIGFLIGLGAVAGEASVNIPVDVPRALLTGLNVSLLAFFFAALALFLSQLLSSRSAAAGWTGGVMVLSFLLDGTGRVVGHGAWIQQVSPVFYYNANKPLIPSYGANFGALALLMGLCVTLEGVSAFLFVKRDVGGSALLSWNRGAPSVRHPRDSLRALDRAQRDVFGRSVGLRAWRAQAAPLFWWLMALVVYAGWCTLLIPSLEAPLRKIYASIPVFAKLFGGHDVGTNAGFLAIIVFAFLPVLAVVFVLVQALTWANDLDSGRLELVLSTPKPRYRVVLERFGVVLFAALAAPLVTWLSIMGGAQIAQVSVDAGKVAAAAVGILPLELIVASLVYALAGRVRSGTILGIATLFIALSYFSDLLRSVLHLPDWAMSLSIFHEYGNPLIDGLKWGPFVAMLGVAAVGLAVGVTQFVRSDVERGAQA